jgi:serine phosphatase RsbU (regulator of sigma subunit)/anti-sigma regulatory factor (Ser/Thr protein kinase)
VADADRRPPRTLLLLAAATGLVVVLAAVGGVLSWQQYRRDVDRDRELVAAAADRTVAETSRLLTVGLAVLESTADLPSVRSNDLAAMTQAFEALASDDLGFSGGVGWVDAAGQLQVEAFVDPAVLPLDLSDREYVRQVLATAAPVVSGGLIGRVSGDPLVALASPTIVDGGVTGAVIASIELARLDDLVPALAEGANALVDTALFDADGRALWVDGRPGDVEVVDAPLPPGGAQGETTIGPGIDGETEIVGAARVVPDLGWTVVVAADTAETVTRHRNELIAKAAGLLLLATITVLVAALAARRMRQSTLAMQRQVEELGALERFTERLTNAGDHAAIADAVVDVMTTHFSAPICAVLVATDDRSQLEMLSVTGVEPSVSDPYRALPLDSPTFFAEVLRTGETLVADVDELDQRDPPSAADARRAGIVGVVAAEFSSTLSAGVVGLAYRDPRSFPPSPTQVRLFETMVALLSDTFARADATERQRVIASELQAAMFPRDRLVGTDRLQRAARYVPALDDARVGGDWYDVFCIDDATVGVVVGDVVGKGIAAGAVMGQVQSVLRSNLLGASSPGEAIEQLDHFAETVDGARYSTVIAASIDLSSGRVDLTAAGHVPPVVVRGGRASIESAVTGWPVGLKRADHRTRAVVDLGNEDLIVLFTDGLVERRGETIDVGLERVRASVERWQDLPAQALADALVRDCGVDRQDDVALVCLRFVGARPRTFSSTAPALAEHLAVLRGELSSWLEPVCDDSGLRSDLVLAAGELLANCVDHAYVGAAPGPMTLEASLDAATLDVVVRDWGGWRPPHFDPTRGRGLSIVRAIVGELDVAALDGGTSMSFRVTLDRSPQPAG